MDVNRIGNGGREIGGAPPRRSPADAPARPADGHVRADRLDLSVAGKVAREAQEEVRRLLAVPESADVDRLKAIQTKLEEGYYDRPEIRQEIAERVADALGVPKAEP